MEERRKLNFEIMQAITKIDVTLDNLVDKLSSHIQEYEKVKDSVDQRLSKVENKIAMAIGAVIVLEVFLKFIK